VAEPLHCYRHPDRETYVSCSECGRGICPDCMVYGPVGIRCPDHASSGGKAAAPRRAARSTIRTFSTGGPIVTQTLIGINVAVFVLELLLGGTLNGVGSWIYENGVLVARATVLPNGEIAPGVIAPSLPTIGVADGEWWRLITAAFLHYGPLHLGLNMLVLWFIGPPLEEYFGHWRYLLVYIVSGLAGSAGALIWSPNALTVGASGAIWGIMGAALILEARRIYVFGGQAMGLVVFNLLITFLIPGVSIGGHIGGLVGGGLCALAFSSFRRSPALATVSMALVGVVAVGLAAAQVA
jgi:membrane associated rhomboid family serine protease